MPLPLLWKFNRFNAEFWFVQLNRHEYHCISLSVPSARGVGEGATAFKTGRLQNASGEAQEDP